MSRKDFQMIADVVRNTPLDGEHPNDSRARLAGDFADALRSTNPNFNRARFLAACGVENA